MFFIEYNGQTSDEMRCAIAHRPSVPAPAKNYEQIEVPGRSGSLILTDNTYSDITIPVEINFIAPPEKWGEHYRAVKNWILGSETPNALVLSDDQEVFYKVKATTISTTDREAREGGTIAVAFLCDPCTYYKAGTRNHTPAECTLNRGAESRPVYTITGANGTATLTVNGNTATAEITGGVLTIDTELRMTTARAVLANSALAGDYDLLTLKPGRNSITISDGYAVTVVPNWRSL